MFRLGIYDEDDARDIAGYLRDAGIKVELRPFLSSSLEIFSYLEGRRSELKAEVDDFEMYEGYLKALVNVLARGPTPESFRDMLLLELDPEVNEKREQVREIFEGFSSEEELDVQNPNFIKYMKDLSEMMMAEEFINTVLRRNEIQIGADVGARLDDPILRIPIDLDDYEEDHPLARTTTNVIFYPMVEINIDEFTLAGVDELDFDFQDEYPDEAIRITALGALLANLIEHPAPGKIDFEAFAERCEFETMEDGNILSIEGSAAADELARVLEKNGIIKVKGDTIKWKG